MSILAAILEIIDGKFIEFELAETLMRTDGGHYNGDNLGQETSNKSHVSSFRHFSNMGNGSGYTKLSDFNLYHA